MISTRTLAVAAGGGLAVLALLAAWVLVFAPRAEESAADMLGRGDYALVTTDGDAFTEATLTGAPSAVFFGFAHCPEVCPTTLSEIDGWQGRLAAEGLDPIRTFFVTVDPERDTARMLGDYVSWARGVTGVSGTPEEVARAMRAFRVFAQRVPLAEGGYTMDHSAMVLLFDANGRFVQPIGYGEAPETALPKLRRLLAG